VGEPIIKRFESSRELILWLVVDPSPSMFLGDPVSPMRWAMEVAGAAMATMGAGKDRLGLLVPGGPGAAAVRLEPKRGRVAGLHLLEALADCGPSLPTAESWQEAFGRWTGQGKGHRIWILSNGAGLGGLAPTLKPIALRHRVVWFRPEHPALRRQPNWPDPALGPAVDRETWNILEDPVVRMGAWLKGGKA
jgi:uncharacterized protein (DUF58 family)